MTMNKNRFLRKMGIGRNTRRPAKQSWGQSIHPYRKEIFVCTGFSAKEMLSAIKEIGAKKWFLDYTVEREKDWQEMIDANYAFVSQEKQHGAFVLRLRRFEDTWEFWECLIHELNHLGRFLAVSVAATEESEAQAYTQEWLFHQIRRKLQGIVPYDHDE